MDGINNEEIYHTGMSILFHQRYMEYFNFNV